jgi:hypothetical protein
VLFLGATGAAPNINRRVIEGSLAKNIKEIYEKRPSD